MNKLCLSGFCFFLFCLCGSAMAGSSTANIHKGNWELGGSASISKYGGSSGTYFLFSPSAQYFLADHFSAGLDLGLARYGSQTNFSISPVFTKYFFVSEKIAPYLSVTPFGLSLYSGYTTGKFSQVNLGLKHFLTDSVSIAPSIYYRNGWGNDGWNSNDSYGSQINFAIHL